MAKFGVGKKMYPELRRLLSPQLPEFLMKQRWFGGKARQIRGADITDIISISSNNFDHLVLITKIRYVDGTEESYAVPLSFAEGAKALREIVPYSLRIEESPKGGQPRILTDALSDEHFLSVLLEMVQQKRVTKGDNGELRALRTTAYAELHPDSFGSLPPRP